MTEGEELGQKSVEREKNSGVYCWSFERGGLEGGNEEGLTHSMQLNLDLQLYAECRRGKTQVRRQGKGRFCSFCVCVLKVLYWLVSASSVCFVYVFNSRNYTT